jgi:hypothetical protein
MIKVQIYFIPNVGEFLKKQVGRVFLVYVVVGHCLTDLITEKYRGAD